MIVMIQKKIKNMGNARPAAFIMRYIGVSNLSSCLIAINVPSKVCSLVMNFCRGVDKNLTKILVVEDEEKIARIVREFLEGEGFVVKLASDGLAAIRLAAKFHPQVVLLDWMLPHLNGIEVCRKLREMGNYGVIMVTAKTEETDKIIGLGVGADDYMTKPFSLRELAARIQSLLRRLPVTPVPSMIGERVFGSLTIITSSHRVLLDQQEISLTPTEYKILDQLTMSPDQVYSREQLLQSVFPEEDILDMRTIDAHISRLRRKLNKGSNDTSYIQTVYGFGYRFGADHEN
jgi:DNA-binding response OmpR family regulator